ncbi:hypothetical protein [Streptomyces pactum]|nr:hypothetical protein [Streptomyces pactum]
MNVLEWLIWATVVGLVWVAFCASDVPAYLSHLLNRHSGGTR